MNILGIDPGLKGAVVLISRRGVPLEKHVMPVVGNVLDVAAVAKLIQATRTIHAYLEKVTAMPGQGVASMFKFGRVYGMLEGILSSLRIPYTLVTPQAWMKELHQGIEKKLSPKERSRIAASRLFPDVDLKANDRCKKPHDGIVDALLIAEYGRRKQFQWDCMEMEWDSERNQQKGRGGK